MLKFIYHATLCRFVGVRLIEIQRFCSPRGTSRAGRHRDKVIFVFDMLQGEGGGGISDVIVASLLSSPASAAMTSSLGSDEQYAEAMHAILSGEPCRGLVTEPTRLLPHVFIGSQSNAEDLTTMRRLGVSHVLNCAGYKGPRPTPNASPYDGLGIHYYEFKVCLHWSPRILQTDRDG